MKYQRDRYATRTRPNKICKNWKPLRLVSSYEKPPKSAKIFSQKSFELKNILL
jgi:hypothetical protein